MLDYSSINEYTLLHNTLRYGALHLQSWYKTELKVFQWTTKRNLVQNKRVSNMLAPYGFTSDKVKVSVWDTSRGNQVTRGEVSASKAGDCREE